MNPIIVTVIEHDVVSEQYLFTGKNASVAAEQKFLGLCSDYCSNYSDFTSEDINNILDDGFIKMLSGKSICIFHPET